MSLEIAVLCAVVGAGTYLTRFLPFLAALRYRRREEESSSGFGSTESGGFGALALIGPSIIAALLITSVLPALSNDDFAGELARSLLALVPTLLVALRRRSLGLTVVTGVASYWLATILL